VTAVPRARRIVVEISRRISQSSLCGICGGQNDFWQDFSLTTSFYHCNYHATNAPYTFIILRNYRVLKKGFIYHAKIMMNDLKVRTSKKTALTYSKIEYFGIRLQRHVKPR
jgi:hypothetical protein